MSNITIDSETPAADAQPAESETKPKKLTKRAKAAKKANATKKAKPAKKVAKSVGERTNKKAEVRTSSFVAS